MEVDNKLSLESVRQFLLSHGGRATQSKLTNHFKDLVSKDDAVKADARRQYKEISNLITYAKEEGGVKYIYLSKKGQLEVTLRQRPRPLSSRKENCHSYTEHQEEHFLTPFASKGAFSQHTCSDAGPTTGTHSSTTDSPPAQGRRKTSSHATRPKSAVALVKSSYQKQLQGSLESLQADDDDYFGHDHDEIQPEEKEWMFACSSGRMEKLKRLLSKHPYLMDNKDFILGYTALHWAGKLGRTDLVDLAVANNTTIDVKSHGGYTALHVASMSGKDEVITKLIDLGANIHARDNNGKKPKDVVKETVSPLVQNKLGRSLILDTKVVLQSGLECSKSGLAVGRSKKSRYSKAFSDEEASPMGTPDSGRRRIRSTGGTDNKGKMEISMPMAQS